MFKKVLPISIIVVLMAMTFGILTAKAQGPTTPYTTAIFTGPAVAYLGDDKYEGDKGTPVTAIIGVHSLTTESFTVTSVYTMTGENGEVIGSGSYGPDVLHGGGYGGPVIQNVMITQAYTLEVMAFGDWGSYVSTATLTAKDTGAMFPPMIKWDSTLPFSVCNGDIVTATFTVTNTEQARIEVGQPIAYLAPMPNVEPKIEYDLITATNGGTYNPTYHLIEWPEAMLLPGESLTRSFQFKLINSGEASSLVLQSYLATFDQDNEMIAVNPSFGYTSAAVICQNTSFIYLPVLRSNS